MEYHVDARNALRRHSVGKNAKTTVYYGRWITKSLRLTVKDTHRMSILQQPIDDMRTDETATATRENFHTLSMFPC